MRVSDRHRRGASLLAALVLVAAVLGVGVFALTVGSADVGFADASRVVARRFGLIAGEDVSVLSDRIVWGLRMPRVVAAIAVGAGLAVCGVVLQSLTRNDLADPYLLGIASGASVGAVSVIVLGLSVPFVASQISVGVMALLGAIGALVAVLVLASSRSGTLPPSRTILAGVAVAQLCGAFTSLVIMVFGERDAARQVLAWTMGSFAGVRWPGAVGVLVGSAAAFLLVLLTAGTLDAFAFGETAARALGISVEATRWVLLVGTALVTAMTVAVVGPIGFVGLVVPHVVRLVTGPVHRNLLPLSALAGGVLLLVADTLARTVRSGTEIPVGVITAAIGAPCMVVLLRRRAKRE